VLFVVNNHSRQLPGPPLLILSIGILAVSTASIFIRYAHEFAPSLVIAAWRLSLASLLLAPIAVTRHRHELSSLHRRELELALLSGLFLAIHFAAWITSLAYTTVASSVVLVSTVPLWVALLSPITIKEPMTKPVLVGMILALLGGAIVGMSDSCSLEAGRLACPSWSEFIQGKAFLGDFLALVGAIAAAGYLIIGRSLRARVSLISYVFVVYGMAAIALVVIMLAAGDRPFGYPPITYLWFLLLALVPQLIGHSTYNWALGYLSVAYVSIALLGEPIGSTILAYFLLGEIPSLFKIVGAVLILVSIYLASRSETTPSNPETPS
jgi:drug/metabolite transporter (DMT)-like permease